MNRKALAHSQARGAIRIQPVRVVGGQRVGNWRARCQLADVVATSRVSAAYSGAMCEP